MNQLHSTNKDLESTNSPTQTFVAQRDILKWISNEYHDLNGTYYDVLDLPPSSLRFSQLVHIARPVLIRNCGIPSDSISRRWTDEYLLQRLADREISIAITPNGRADAVMDGPDGRKYFVEPHVQKMTMSNFLANLSTDCCIGDEVAGRMKEIHYLQSQNGNLYSNRYFDLGPKNDPSEFESLRSDVPSEILWCSEALGKVDPQTLSISGLVIARALPVYTVIHTRTSTLSFGEQSTLRCCLRLRDGVWKSTRTHRQDTRAHPCRHN
ncbi:hypothetical protein AcW2_006713 [Taiwanofungus camphoratus]|nr:hypothetical protein AcW2_006713 [Antrodia cinnamomea]